MPKIYCRLLLAIATIFVACSCQQSPAPQESASLDQPTIVRLRRFQESVVADSTTDEEGLKQLNDLNQKITERQLPTVEKFALTDEAKPIAWALARLLIERKRFDAAANVLVTALLPEAGNREYRMWKWWEYSFGERLDFKELNALITESLFAQFAKGPAIRKEVVAELFGKGPAEAKLTIDQFKALVTAGHSN